MADNSKEEIIAHMERITSSSIFASSPRLIQFLRFCVTTSLNGEADQLKESMIGVSVFGRAPDYNPRIDPIVRVHARRLRDKLDSFYETEGQEEHILVEIPKGGYIPNFQWRGDSPEDTDTSRLDEQTATPSVAAETPSTFPVASTLRKTIFAPLTLQNGIILGLCAIAFCCVAYVVFDRPQLGLFAWPRAAQTITSTATNTRTVSVAALPATERDLSWSPDGKSVAFAWSEGRNAQTHIYSMNVSGGSPTLLTQSTLSEFRPVWSPDGNQLAFLRQTNRFRYQVVIQDHRTHAERVLVTQSFESPVVGELPALDWSHNGQWIVTSEERAAEPAHLLLVPASGGQARQITDPPKASTGDVGAHFSPDGTQIAFRRGDVGDIWLVPLTGPEAMSARPVTLDHVSVSELSGQQL